MLQTEVHQYLERFFKANGCPIEENHPGYMQVQLTVDMDKELMNRPFYWTYVEKIGSDPNPMKVTFITDPQKAPDSVEGEVIHFGAPRLHQLFATTKKLAAYIRLYEAPAEMAMANGQQTALHPWLHLNLKVSYICDVKRDVFRSFGLNLINGTLIEGFHDRLSKIDLVPKIPDFCFTISPIIMPQSGLRRIEHFITNELKAENDDWAKEAEKRWREDIELLEHFYSDQPQKPDIYELELSGLQDQYEPHIQIDIINGGIVYVTPFSV